MTKIKRIIVYICIFIFLCGVNFATNKYFKKSGYEAGYEKGYIDGNYNGYKEIIREKEKYEVITGMNVYSNIGSCNFILMGEGDAGDINILKENVVVYGCNFYDYRRIDESDQK